jgi:hypothetical protein
MHASELLLTRGDSCWPDVRREAKEGFCGVRPHHTLAGRLTWRCRWVAKAWIALPRAEAMKLTLEASLIGS